MCNLFNFNKIKMKQIILTIILAVSLINCKTFVKISDKTEFGREDGFIKVCNPAANFKSLTYGDFKFATTKDIYKELKAEKSNIRNILFYAKTPDPSYEYYVLLNPKNKNFNLQKYVVKDTVLSNKNFVILVSKAAPQSDIKFITSKIFEINSN